MNIEIATSLRKAKACDVPWDPVHTRPLQIHENPLGTICLLKIGIGEGRCGCHVTQTFSLQFSVLSSEPQTSNHRQLLQSHILHKSWFLQGKRLRCAIYFSPRILQMQPHGCFFFERLKSLFQLNLNKTYSHSEINLWKYQTCLLDRSILYCL
jgi:hypothetical protein